MSDNEQISDPLLHRRLPVAGLRVWTADGGAEEATDAVQQAMDRLAGLDGLRCIEPGLFAVLPVPGDPAAFDSALAWAQQLPGRGGFGMEAESPLRVLIFPTVALVSGDTAELIPDPLLEALATRPPELTGSGVFLTSRASQMLERPVRFIRGGSYQTPAGPSIPLVMAGTPRNDAPPWRNPELLGRRLRFLPRGDATGLDDQLERPACRVVGPLGCGKTRMVWQALDRRPGKFLWLQCRPNRCPSPSLGDQIIQHLLSPTREQRENPRHPGSSAGEIHEEVRKQLAAWRLESDLSEPDMLAGVTHLMLERLTAETGESITLAVDDVQLISGQDLEFIAKLLGSSALGSLFRLVLIGRGGGWPSELEALSTLEVGAASDEENERLAASMVDGLSLPESVRERFLEASRGNPLAFEEGLLGLVHERAFRRVYGSFFFGGDETINYRPSLRLVRLLDAEAGRLGASLPAALVSLHDTPLPAAELESVAVDLGASPTEGWRDRLVQSGLLANAESPWGEGLEPACPAFGYALSFTFPGKEAGRARHLLGSLLLEHSEEGIQSWQTYRLLSGSDRAVAPLLAAASGPSAAEIPREELLSTLSEELRLLRERDGDPDLEMELLWKLLPLARRLGNLNAFSGELGRAMELSESRPERLLAVAGIKAELEHEAGRHSQAEATIRRALEAAAGADRRRQAVLLVQLGKILLRQGQLEEASKIFDGLLSALRDAGSTALEATCRFFLGNIALQDGRLEEAHEHHKAALEERLRRKLKRAAGSSLSALGSVQIAMGDYPRALGYFRQAEETLAGPGLETESSFALLGMGRALSRLGDFTAASKPLRQALALREGRDDVAGEAIARLAVASNYLQLGQPENALSEARQAHFQLSLLSREDELAKAEQILGRIRFHQRRYDSARRHFAAALEAHGKRGDPLEAAFDHAWLLETALAEQDGERVSQHAADLKEMLGRVRRPELGEILNFRLFRGLEWLSQHGHKVGDPSPYLERAYRQVLDKAQHLEPEQRHRYLFQIDVNQQIVEVATRLGVAT